jgi:hypothetical protein
MALIVNIDEANRQIVLDRALPTGANRPFGANASEIAERHTRVQRWDQTGATNTVDGDGLILTGAGPIPIEDGIQVEFSVDPTGGLFRAGDYWVFWARTATAQIEELTNAPPRGIVHHYMQIAAITGLGTAQPGITDCRPPQPKSTECCCTIVVRPGESIQAGIDALPAQGGCVCLKAGVHVVRETLRIARGNIVLEAESPGTIVRMQGQGPALIIGNPQGTRVEGVDVLGIDFEATTPAGDVDGVITILTSARVRISLCGLASLRAANFLGIHATGTDWLTVARCRFQQLAAGIVVRERCEGFEADSNLIDFTGREGLPAFYGIAYVESAFPCRITRNTISGAMFAILVNDQPFGDPQSMADLSIVRDNLVVCPRLPDVLANRRVVAIDVAAGGCTVAGNRVRYADRAYIGIRLSGSASEATENILVSTMRASDALGPLGIQVGDTSQRAIVLGGAVAHNAIVGPQHGVMCLDTTGFVVEANLVEPKTNDDGEIAIAAMRAIGSQFTGNQVDGAFNALVFMGGRQNRISSNDCRRGSSGITLFQETGPEIAGNRLDALDRWGVFALEIAARLDILENRLVGCAAKMTNIAFAIGCSTVVGEANIAGNEVMDTGSGGGAQASSTVDYGIVGDLVLEARIEGNLVTYSNVQSRDPQREDRALVMRGLLDVQTGNVATVGFAIQVLGNKFIGTGRTALVELRESQLSNTTFVRFERVSFDNNYCAHFAIPVLATGQVATVWLVGRRAIVMGNHIKATTRAFPSVNFNSMPGPYIGNVTAGGTLNHSDFPAPAASFNMIAF